MADAGTAQNGGLGDHWRVHEVVDLPEAAVGDVVVCRSYGLAGPSCGVRQTLQCNVSGRRGSRRSRSENVG